MDKKILTVIIPAFNTEKYIYRCLESVNHPLVNVIIVDDGSTDNTAGMVDSYCTSHDNFRVIHTNNNGAAAARLTGLKEVKTTFFSFVDSDDIANISVSVKLCQTMNKHDYKVGIGRMCVYLPNCSFPFYSKKWKKSNVDFQKDKSFLANTTCSLLDKIWHIDCKELFMEKSKQLVYEDMEFVYYVLAKINRVYHTNDVIYKYCMRGLTNNSTSSLGLQMTKVEGIKGLLEAATSMKSKFCKDNIYNDFKSELDSIIIKLFFQRVFYVLISRKIINKTEMANLIFGMLNLYIPNWESNTYYLANFRGSEYNDYLYYIATKFLIKLYKVNIKNNGNNINELFDKYTKAIKQKD